ncbi:DUF3987 domain-containing protein [Microcoleus sp. D2_18a_B4]|uniref:DUF3987 domain-containing protein n=1 Tax=Microcoleus sp. D2_18a_B4 TaxID=3055329 RepID=UPI002FD6281F
MYDMYATNPSHIEKLIEAIAKMPEDWALTPCKGKANQWPAWNKERLSRETLIAAIRSQTNNDGKKTLWTGVSIVTGPLSGGIMAVDFDGPLAYKKYCALSGGDSYPTTKRWSSGKEGHFQILLEVPEEKWEGLKPTKFFILNPAYRIELGLSTEAIAQTVETTVENIEQWESGTTSPIPPAITKKLTEIYSCNNSEFCQKLEFRWNECSTLPPSIHPDTGKPYFWKNEGDIAEVPYFILDLMREAPAVELPKKPSVQNTIYIDAEKSLVDILDNEILPRLDAEEFYGNWVALKKSGDSLKGLCPFHQEKTGSFSVSPAEKLFKCFGCGVGGGPVQFLHQIKGGTGSPTGKEFHEVVMELAGKVGVQIPDRQQQRQTHNLKPNTQNPKPNNVLKHPANYTPEPAPATEIIEHADSLLEEELTPTNQIIGAIAAAKRAGLSPRDFREILVERQAEQNLDWSILDSTSKFKQLHQIQNTSINLREFFPPALATALLSKAESDRIDPVRIVQSLLPVVGTMLGGHVGIEIKPGDEEDDAWVEYPIIYTVDVGYASTGKSATQNSLVKPLKKMQAAEQERIDEVLNELVQLEEAWKEMSKEERAEKAESEENPRVFNEKHCKPKKWIFNPQRASAQAITKRIAEQQPKHGCLLLQDELSGLFDSLDQFTGGNSGQRQFLLEAWNGRLEGSVDRVDLKADSYTFKEQTINITGTIQPDIARRIFNMTSDPDGMLSRFLPAVAGIPDNFAQRPTVRVSLNRMMTELIKALERIPETLLTMPARTADIYWDYWEQLRHIQQASFGDNPTYSQFVGKQQSYVGRFAIVLHCLENLGAPEIPSRVTPEIMHKAVRLSLFYCNQFLLLQSKSAQQQPIEGILLDILKFAQQQGGTLTTRQLCQSRFRRLQIEGKKFSAYFAQKFLQAIADAGYGTFKDKTLNLLSLLSPVVGGVVALKPIENKALSAVCCQNPKVYISENSQANSLAHTESISDGLIDEFTEECSQISENYNNLISLVPNELLEASDKRAADEARQWKENSANMSFPEMTTLNPQTLTESEKPATTPRQQTTTNDNKRQHLENSNQLNESEIELLEYLQKAVTEKDAYFAQQVRGILKEVCGTGAADRKKVWGALGDAEQKTFTELLAVEIPAEVGHVLEAMQQILGSSDDPNEVDHLYRVFAPELIDRAITLLRETDKSTILHWIAVRDLATNLMEAVFDGAVTDVAAAHPADLVELAITRLEFLKEHDAVDEIRDALS